MSDTSSPKVKTFGCRLNSYESEVMKNHLSSAGLNDVIVFNTCAVTQEAERQVKQAIRKAHRENPEKRIIVTGCASQISPEVYANIEGVDTIISNDKKLKPDTWENLDETSHITSNILEVKDIDTPIINGFEGRARAIVQVQQGCDHRCTFCIIPYGRGNSRSVPVDEICNQINRLVEQGFQEVVLTGVDITSYGHDLPSEPSLGLMIRRVLNNVMDLPRLRLSSIDPVEIDDELWGLIENASLGSSR
jgi:threonylcarbamoyladenosine tRNA methylthiotransferase MtaB